MFKNTMELDEREVRWNNELENTSIEKQYLKVQNSEVSSIERLKAFFLFDFYKFKQGGT